MGGTRSIDSDAHAPGPIEAIGLGDLVGGIYRVERLLGEGGGGAVYLVRHGGLDGARFALKVLREAPGRSGEALLREGRVAAEVRSAHVVKVTGTGRLPHGAPYLVMEYVEGPTLDALLALGELTREVAADCARQLCLALEAAHAEGLLHGDVSLRNVFATPKPDGSLHVQLGDFGLARRIRREIGTTISIDLGVARGTPRFMAPETISGADAVDERADVYSVGVVLYRLLAGSFPFDGESVREILAAVLRGSPVPLAQRRAGLEAFEPLTMRCLAGDPALRFRDARGLREAIEAALVAAPAAAAPVEVPARSPRGRARSFAAGAVFVAAAVAATVAGARAWRQRAHFPVGAAIACADTESALPEMDAPLRHTIAAALCARVGAALDVDWGGGPDATSIATRLMRDPDGAYDLDLAVAGRVETAHGATPWAAMLDGAQLLAARADHPAMSVAEMHAWGADDPASAAAERAVWRRRTALVIDDYEQEPRAALALDPSLPFAHLLLAEVERDPQRRSEAREKVRALADRLPPDRAAAVRAFVAVQEAPEAAAAALEQLRRAYSSSPDDLDIGVLYAGALVVAGRAETALAVVESVHAREPRRAALAVHYATTLPAHDVDAAARLVGWLVDALPEARASTPNICLLAYGDHLAEADAALAFARRLGVPDERLAIPETVVALALGDPARIERATAAPEGTTRSWSQLVGGRLRYAGLLLRGRVAAAETFLQSEIAARRAAGDTPNALNYAVERLRIARLAGGPSLDVADLDRLEADLAATPLALPAYVTARVELALARGAGSAAASRALAVLDEEITRRAGADALALAAARLRTLPLARLARADVLARWRAASSAFLEDRVRAAYEAGLALEATAPDDAEAAYRLAASPYVIDRHPFESIAARVRLADLLVARGHAEEAAPLLAHVDLAWAQADGALRDEVRRAVPE